MKHPGGTCPFCFAHLDEFWCSVLQWEGGYFWMQGDYGDYECKHTGDVVEMEFSCRNCELVITTDTEEAEAILKGEGPWV